MDALSDVLRIAQLNGGVFLNAEFTAPWCLAARLVPELYVPMLGTTGHLVPYHLVAEGEMWVSVEGHEPMLLRQGEIILFPRNDLHRMGSDLGVPVASIREILLSFRGSGPHRIRHGGGGALTRLICGYLSCASARGNPVLMALPPAIRLDLKRVGASAWFHSMFEYAASELVADQPGS